MHFVLLATHTPDTCPTANAATRDLMLKTAPDLPNLAQKAGVDIVAGPFVNREHTVVAVVQSDKAENVDRFLMESRLSQWNSVHVLPSLTLEEGLTEIQAQTPIF
ncbi:hypothetical protein [Streptomyces roseochromogenus]|uniref:YCII-related domain-containing protein n=1 Tax=Streptomyces roseochromogenus subsp. oscitans DS 12.976 TaxID=1352936 RepID=V6KRK0_STRRC|nr:hypothetical protein [Streptomyces roseochromogenus]EST34785.1 hypothetical protein M878_08925 [Streptomyces roseochromogenus subsp. oscitans DS 12.976]